MRPYRDGCIMRRFVPVGSKEIAWAVPRPIKSQQFQQSHFESDRYKLGTMAGGTDKSRRYLHWAAVNERRAASAYDEELKALLLGIAAQYRDLALQIDDPLQWRAKLIESRRAKQD